MSFRKKINVRPLLPKGKSDSSINGDSKQGTISEETRTFNPTDLEHRKMKTGSKNKLYFFIYFLVLLWKIICSCSGISSGFQMPVYQFGHPNYLPRLKKN